MEPGHLRRHRRVRARPGRAGRARVRRLLALGRDGARRRSHRASAGPAADRVRDHDQGKLEPSHRALPAGRSLRHEPARGADRARPRRRGAARTPTATAVLFDLGIGALAGRRLRARVRSAGRRAACARIAGHRVLAPGNPAMGVILATSPHRVFISRLGRIEVCQPIPPHDGKKPGGPAHPCAARPAAHRRTHAATEPIPDGLVPCAHVYPAAPGQGCARPRRGRSIPRRHDAFQAMLRHVRRPGFQIALKQRVLAAVAAGEIRRSFRSPGALPHQHPRGAAPVARRRGDVPSLRPGSRRTSVARRRADDARTERPGWRRMSLSRARGRPMDGIHDMGGMEGFGKVEPEPNEPVFHAPWEGPRARACNRAMGYAGFWTSTSRASRSKVAAGDLSHRVLLPEVGVRLEQRLIEFGYRRRRRGGGRPLAARRASRCRAR